MVKPGSRLAYLVGPGSPGYRTRSLGIIVLLPVPRNGNCWMFWASFSGDIKRMYLFWMKDWGTMTVERYRKKIFFFG